MAGGQGIVRCFPPSSGAWRFVFCVSGFEDTRFGTEYDRLVRHLSPSKRNSVNLFAAGKRGRRRRAARRSSSVAMSLLGSSVTSYADELRIKRPGKSPRRSPVIKLGTTEAEARRNGPGPATYSPCEPARFRTAQAWSMSDGRGPSNNLAAKNAAASPGPIYALRSTMGGLNVQSAVRTSPRFGFGTATRPDAVSMAKRGGASPGPGTYDDTYAALGSSSRSASSSRGRQSPPHKPMDRSLGGTSIGPGPAAYSPTKKSSAPAYSIGGVSGVPESQAKSPGPAMYVTRATSRFGGGYMGDAPSGIISSREKGGNRYLSKEHSKIAQFGKHSPGPASYTPREMVGVVDDTNSNTSTHAPKWVFGSEKRAVG